MFKSKDWWTKISYFIAFKIDNKNLNINKMNDQVLGKRSLDLLVIKEAPHTKIQLTIIQLNSKLIITKARSFQIISSNFSTTFSRDKKLRKSYSLLPKWILNLSKNLQIKIKHSILKNQLQWKQDHKAKKLKRN